MNHITQSGRAQVDELHKLLRLKRYHAWYRIACLHNTVLIAMTYCRHPAWPSTFAQLRLGVAAAIAIADIFIADCSSEMRYLASRRRLFCDVRINIGHFLFALRAKRLLFIVCSEELFLFMYFPFSKRCSTRSGCALPPCP